MSESSLLPSSATDLQHALAATTATDIDLNHNLIRISRDPLQCDARLLPWLAWENSIDDAEGWIFAESEEDQRKLIADYIAKHELKGTPASIRRLFYDLGLGEIDIIENIGNLRYDGSQIHNGHRIYGGAEGTWAIYSIIMKERPITAGQAEFLKQILNGIAPARCQLHQIIYSQVAIRYDGAAVYDGLYNHGSING